MRHSGASNSKGDQNELEVAKRVRRRESLSETILGKRCLPEVQRLFDWSNDPSDTRGITAAAEIVLTAIQNELRAADTLEHVAGFELAYAKAWAILALVDSLGVGKAKAVELRLTDGAPLAICTGRTWRKIGRYDPPPFLGRIVEGELIREGLTVSFQVPAFGCFKVFPDATRTSAHPWKHWCPECAPTRSKRPRQVRRAHAQALNS
jgi:hypothetical protein